MLPDIYAFATARNVTPVCPRSQRIGVGFNLESGGEVRLALALQDARFLRDCLNDYIQQASAASEGEQGAPNA